MNKTDLVKKISKKSALSQKEALSALNATMELIKEALKQGDNVQLTGFGKFEIKNRKSRVAYNPILQTKQVIPATRVPVFKMGKSFKQKILA